EIGKFDCSFKIARKSTGGSSASASGGVAAASFNLKRLKGTWKGEMSCGNNGSFVNDPNKPFSGDAEYTRDVTMKIKDGKISFMRAATAKGTPKLDLASSTIGSDGKISVEGSFVSKKSGKTFTYKFDGMTDGKKIALWGQMDKAKRGCKAVYSR
ncbi:MAG: hypothetical protein WD407_07665, partial [Rhodospirillales bacterium]